MPSPRRNSAFKIAAAAAVFLISALPSVAGDRRPASPAPIRWHVVGIVSGLANPTTTEAYFPRPLSAGELVEFNITVNANVAGSVQTAYASYGGAITSAVVSGSDWTINMKAPLASGSITVTNDHPDYGDSLDLLATTAANADKTWFNFEIHLANPGGPNPGVGPWQPFSSLALPKTPPALGSFPNTVFYLIARRDVAGQQADGGAYFGQVLSITPVACH